MKKTFLKLVTAGSIVMAGASMTGCSDFQRGLATGAAVGVVGSSIYYYHGHNFGPNRNWRYRTGVRDGCRSAEVRWTRNPYKWRHFPAYRRGWRAGFRMCSR